MISKSSVGMLMTVAALFFATPLVNVSAAISSADKAKINKYFKQLKALPNAATPAAKVSSLVVKLTKLDPAKANKYYKLGLSKLANTGGTAAGNATKMALQVSKIVKKSGLASGKINSILRQITKSDENYIPPPPVS